MATRKNAVVPQSASAPFTDEFVAHGRVYRWREDASARAPEVLATREIARRAELAALFLRAVVPGLERRGAAGLTIPAAPPPGAAPTDARWVSWCAPGDAVPVWGLYLAAKHLAPAADVPANDAFVLVAWGDGPALAWAHDAPSARAALRAALRVPPPWMLLGMRSRDATLPVRIERLGAAPGVAPCVAGLPSTSRRAATERRAPVLVLPHRATRARRG